MPLSPMATDISDPSTDEISFLRKLYDAGGELSLQGNVGLKKLERLFPDYVTQQSAGMDTVHFTITEKGREFINRWWLKPQR
jgi:hypothetical protein